MSFPAQARMFETVSLYFIRVDNMSFITPVFFYIKKKTCQLLEYPITTMVVKNLGEGFFLSQFQFFMPFSLKNISKTTYHLTDLKSLKQNQNELSKKKNLN
jgi:hypothetical protein